MAASLIVAVLGLGGCAAAGDHDTPTYRAGFADGCSTASGRGAARAPRAPQRNAALYEGDADYRAGWATGNATCGASNSPGLPFQDGGPIRP